MAADPDFGARDPPAPGGHGGAAGQAALPPRAHGQERHAAAAEGARPTKQQTPGKT